MARGEPLASTGRIPALGVVFAVVLFTRPAVAQDPAPPPAPPSAEAAAPEGPPAPFEPTAEHLPGFEWSTPMGLSSISDEQADRAHRAGIHPSGSVIAPVGTHVALDAVGVLGGGLDPLAAALVRGRVGVSRRFALGLSAPVVIGIDGLSLDLGNLALESAWRLSNPDASSPLSWTGGIRLLVPSATSRSRFAIIPSQDRLGGGLEGAAAARIVRDDWALHIELGGGTYFETGEALSPLRLFLSVAGRYRMAGPVHAVAQLDPWLVWGRPQNSFAAERQPLGQLGLAAGIETVLDQVELRLMYQKVVHHAPDHHVWLSVAVHLGDG